MRVVLDTNVVASAFVQPLGNPRRILEAWEQGTFDVAVSEPILAEYREVLQRPRLARRHGLTDEEIDLALQTLRRISIYVDTTQPVQAVSDPDDDKFVECALAAEAEMIVSGDVDLLQLGAYGGVQILTPAAFVSLLSQEK